METGRNLVGGWFDSRHHPRSYGHVHRAWRGEVTGFTKGTLCVHTIIGNGETPTVRQTD